MNNWLDIKNVATGVILLAVGWMAREIFGWIRYRLDGKKIENWLRDNTKDEPGESHKTIANISRVLGLPDDRVVKGIAKNRSIYRSSTNTEDVSVWRAEPESIYERRGVRFV